MVKNNRMSIPSKASCVVWQTHSEPQISISYFRSQCREAPDYVTILNHRHKSGTSHLARLKYLDAKKTKRDSQWFSCFCVHAKLLLQSCPTLCGPMDCSLPGSSIHGILQARILEWVAMPSSRGSSWPRDQTWVSWFSCIVGGFFTAEPLGKTEPQFTHL